MSWCAVAAKTKQSTNHEITIVSRLYFCCQLLSRNKVSSTSINGIILAGWHNVGLDQFNHVWRMVAEVKSADEWIVNNCVCHLTFCVESLQSIVSALSQVESEGEVGANPTAAASAASSSGINPVSRDGYCCFIFFDRNVEGICRSWKVLKIIELSFS